MFGSSFRFLLFSFVERKADPRSSSFAVIRPFKPLMEFEVVMAMEASPNSQKTALEPEGSFPSLLFVERVELSS